jgi:hypothetical protein
MKSISVNVSNLTKKIVLLKVNTNFVASMLKTINVFKILSLALLIVLVTGSGCAAAKQNPYAKKRKSSSHVSTSQLGRNRYYFSTDYQKKLTKKYKDR